VHPISVNTRPSFSWQCTSIGRHHVWSNVRCHVSSDQSAMNLQNIEILKSKMSASFEKDIDLIFLPICVFNNVFVDSR